jgi:hypothetical protein
MKIDQAIWDRAQTTAILTGRSMTQLVEEALELLLERKRKERDDGERDQDAVG